MYKLTVFLCDIPEYNCFAN